tara:strand:+ start:116 stop:772 length:657 start_codon:yes stop_codon:yes gene_type:complete
MLPNLGRLTLQQEDSRKGILKKDVERDVDEKKKKKLPVTFPELPHEQWKKECIDVPWNLINLGKGKLGEPSIKYYLDDVLLDQRLSKIQGYDWPYETSINYWEVQDWAKNKYKETYGTYVKKGTTFVVQLKDLDYKDAAGEDMWTRRYCLVPLESTKLLERLQQALKYAKRFYTTKNIPTEDYTKKMIASIEDNRKYYITLLEKAIWRVRRKQLGLPW